MVKGIRSNKARKTDLLTIYIQHSIIDSHYPTLLAIALVLLKLYLYEAPSTIEYFCAIGLGTLAVLFLQNQKELYRAIKGGDRSIEKKYKSILLQIFVNKVGYNIPLLLMLYWPIYTDTVFTHIVGFTFTFGAISLYASTSSSYFRFFLADLSLQIIFAASILLLNYQSDTLLIFGTALCLLSFVATVVGWKLYQSSLEMIAKNNELARAVNTIKKAKKYKDDFWAIMSHEIRTPLNGIIGMMKFLEETELSDEQKKYISTAANCSTSLLNTLNDVLDISKIEAGKFDIIDTNFNVKDLVENTARVFEIPAKEKQLEFKTLFQDEVPTHIISDPNRIRQVLTNLCNNAIKFTDEGHVQIQISMSEMENQTYVRFEISDTGIGINAEDKNKLFKRFSQVHKSGEKLYEGTGLGLAISYHLIKLLDGQIGMHSAGDEGSVFWFEVPYKEASTTEDDTDDIQTEVESQEPSSMHVLIVEDNEVNNLIIEKLLTKSGHSFENAVSGEDAIERVKNGAFDIILMDINMPGMGGISACREIKSLDTPNKAAPIFAMTANIIDTQIMKYKEAGMVDCIPKPVDHVKFFKTIEKHIKLNAAATRKTVDQETKSNNTRMVKHITSIKDEFGDDFIQQLVDRNLPRLEELMIIMQKHYKKSQYNKVAETAHDIIAVSGNIALFATSDLARSIEKNCLDKKIDDLEGNLQVIEIVSKKEIEALKDQL
jgi:signal transduction histidine kinase/CheY-like chemotaxis protein/HPt (histidine-containing phosphotransfer) domain-containing protein